MKTAISVPNEVDRGERDVLEDLLVLTRRELAEQQAGERHQDREEDEVVEHALAHRLAEGVGGDGERCGSALPPSPRSLGGARRRAAHLLEEVVLERPPHGLHAEHAPAGRLDRRARAGRASPPRPRAAGGRPPARRAAPAPSPGVPGPTPAARSSRCVTSSRKSSPSGPTLSSRPPRSTATRSQSVSASERMWVENSTVLPRLAQVEDQVAHEAPSDRVEARHRLVEQNQLRVVDERLGEPSPLQHALREAPQRHAGGALEPDERQQLARSAPGGPRAACRTGVLRSRGTRPAVR